MLILFPYKKHIVTSENIEFLRMTIKEPLVLGDNVVQIKTHIGFTYVKADNSGDTTFDDAMLLSVMAYHAPVIEELAKR